eukprot:SAG31_NODE_6592_length_1959_cov_1.082796_1_plen_69_part_10
MHQVLELSDLARPVALDQLWELIGSKQAPLIESLAPEDGTGMIVKRVTWTEAGSDENERRWGGPPPTIS